jgi:hypothetical protein
MDTSAPSEPRLVVLAGNYREFLFWCRENDRNPRDWNLTYVEQAYKLRGMHGFDYTIYGTFWDRRDSQDIYWAMRARLGMR